MWFRGLEKALFARVVLLLALIHNCQTGGGGGGGGGGGKKGKKQQCYLLNSKQLHALHMYIQYSAPPLKSHTY